MGINKSKKELREHKDAAIKKLDFVLESIINSNNPSKADKLCYWIKTYANFINYEQRFDPKKLRRYKRGEIIKIDLGFRVGSEEGGLHYAIVLDKDNNLSSPTLTVIPLTSHKKTKEPYQFRDSEVFLDNELFNSLNLKLSEEKRLSEYKTKTLLENLTLFETSLEKVSSQISFEKIDGIFKDEIVKMQNKLDEVKKHDILISKIEREIGRMKLGSIALINQITTISKIRVYDPKTNDDVLSRVKLSNDKLNLIDDCVKKLFTNIDKTIK
ncbi:type II toxin-antitoxin system PemK/MazF family toxin [Acetobacterium carbinolicum]|uniref:type II toxin-antitoxin system PemK/MazF family toxin n=1 Tax=Acetobacterium carbinolicum TaxID=52690 RepID=UPI0039C9F85F